MITPRHVIMFQPRFAGLVREGKKCQTIRPPRKRPIAVGDELDLRAWASRPYWSMQLHLCTGRECTQVGTVELFTTVGKSTKIIDRFLLVDGVRVLGQEKDRFAQLDGFDSFEAMFAWFQSTHGLPFKEVLIRW